MPSDVLANTCFVTTRDEEPIKGFQRMLDQKRAQQIADYIDMGFGTIPTSIVLSAQPAAHLKIIGSGKTLEFIDVPRAFLILDGQHRVFGFSLAKTALRVPVVIYNNLAPRDESRLFIDINTKQRPVPNELLLDIKKLAESQTETEQLMSEVFDLFDQNSDSALLGLMSPHERSTKKISRVTFNAGLKPLLGILGSADADEIYAALNSYLSAFLAGAKKLKAADSIVKPTLFKASFLLFKDAAQRVQDRYGKDYSSEHFSEVLSPFFQNVKSSVLKNPPTSLRELQEEFSKNFKTSFTL